MGARSSLGCDIPTTWHHGGAGYAIAVASVFGQPTNLLLERRRGDQIATAVIALPAGWTQTDVTIHWVVASDAERSARADQALDGGNRCASP